MADNLDKKKEKKEKWLGKLCATKAFADSKDNCETWAQVKLDNMEGCYKCRSEQKFALMKCKA